MMVVLPADTPERLPDELIVATAVKLLAHVPPASALLKPEAAPAHISRLPVMAPGKGLTVTAWMALHPVLKA